MNMKKFIFAFFCVFWSFGAFSQEVSDKVFLDLQTTEDEGRDIGFVDMFGTAVEVGHYFDKNYPGDLIETDLKPDIEKFFPEATRQQIYDRESLIRGSIKAFRWVKAKIEEIKSKFLVPDLPILTYKDSEYENPSDYTYVDVGNDNVFITTDIKKVISYSSDPKEIETYEAYKERKEDYAKIEELFPGLTRLKRVYDKIELKKLPFYGLIYDDPKTDGEGISLWQKQKHLKVRVASDVSRLEGHSQIKGVIQFGLDVGQVLLAEPYGQYSEVQVDFGKSKNISGCQLFRPVPHRKLFDDGDLIVYLNNFAYPFICDVTDTQKDTEIQAEITYALCNEDKKCFNDKAQVKLEMKAGNGFSTVMKNFITQSFAYLPDMREDKISVRDVSVEENEQSPSGQTLRIIVDSDRAVNKPEFFVRADNHIRFGRPRIAVENHRISARLDILDADVSLIGKPVEITFMTHGTNYYRLYKTVTSASIFDINSRHLTVGLWLLAMLGGFLLNFMPCVFPVLSLKFLSLTQFGAKNQKQVRQSFLLSIFGILGGFFILATVLSILKTLGKNLGWGMQFQNPVFLVGMIFAILLFLAQLNGIISFCLFSYDKVQKQKFSQRWDAFLSGLLVVLMATPCTGPYLGTTIGFALSGTPADIFAILTAVAVGLALPYVLLCCMPDLSLFIPRPGPWMQKIHLLMNIMLLLTLVWLFSLLPAQSSVMTTLGIIGLAVLFFAFLYMYRYSLIEVKSTMQQDTKLQSKALSVLRLIYGSILLLLFSVALVTGYKGFNHHREELVLQKVSELDFNQIGEDVQKGYNVLVKIGADWCLTCSYNNFLVFDNIGAEDLIKMYHLKIIEVDWTTYDSRILEFMGEYGRRGLPFYILYNRNIPEGLVLPELLSLMEFQNILNGNAVKEQSLDVRTDE